MKRRFMTGRGRRRPTAGARPGVVEAPLANREALLRLLGRQISATERWVWEQYDHLILGNSVRPPGRRRRPSSG